MVLQTSNDETKPVTMLRLPDQETVPQDMASENAHPELWPHNLVNALVTLWTKHEPQPDQWLNIQPELDQHLKHLQLIFKHGEPLTRSLEGGTILQKVERDRDTAFQIQQLTSQWYNNGLIMMQSWLAGKITPNWAPENYTPEPRHHDPVDDEDQVDETDEEQQCQNHPVHTNLD